MANQTGRPIAPARKLVALVIGTLAAFVIVYGLGLDSWPVAAFGLVVLALAVALALVPAARRGGRTTIIGSAEILGVSPASPPLTSEYGRAEIEAIVITPGLGSAQAVIIEPRVPVGKWPEPGSTVPVTIEVGDKRRVRVNWSDAADRLEGAEVPPQPTAREYAESDEIDDEVFGPADPAPWEQRDRDWPFSNNDEPPPPPQPAHRSGFAEDEAGPPVVVRDTPDGTIVEGQLVDVDEEPPPLPRRAGKRFRPGGPAEGAGGSSGSPLDQPAGYAAASTTTTASDPGFASGNTAPSIAVPSARTASRPAGSRPSPRPRSGTATATVEPETVSTVSESPTAATAAGPQVATGMPPTQRTSTESTPPGDPVIDLPLDEPTTPAAPGSTADPARPAATTFVPGQPSNPWQSRHTTAAAASEPPAAEAQAAAMPTSGPTPEDPVVFSAGADADSTAAWRRPAAQPEAPVTDDPDPRSAATEPRPEQTDRPGHSAAATGFAAAAGAAAGAAAAGAAAAHLTRPRSEPSAPADSPHESASEPGPALAPQPGRARPEPTPASAPATPIPVTAPPTAPEPNRPFPTAPAPSTPIHAGPAAPPDDEIDLPLDGDPEPSPETKPPASAAMAAGVMAQPADAAATPADESRPAPADSAATAAPQESTAGSVPPGAAAAAGAVAGAAAGAVIGRAAVPDPADQQSSSGRPAPGGAWSDLGGRHEPDDKVGEVITAYPSARPGPAGAIHGVGITVLVTDLTRSIAFYRDILGFFEIDNGDGNAVLASGDTRLVLRTVQALSAEAGRLIYLNLEVGDIDAVHTELQKKGVKFVHSPRSVNRGDKLELWSATFRDPDGHNIAITQWRAIR